MTLANSIDNLLVKVPEVRDLVWGRSLTFLNNSTEATLVERCERITECDKDSVKTVMLYGTIGKSQQVTEYIDDTGVIWTSGDISTYPLSRLKMKVSKKGHVWWILGPKNG